MEEVRQLVQEEGREARNLVAFHVAVDTPGRVARKPPRATAPPPRRAPPRPASRLRSASAGRDKRSELRARYWALLFGDLQRAVGEIYNTVEANENQNECQEVILVLENYTRDFKALGEWFRLKWDYDNTPPPQRPQSLAWEIRKTDFVRPESRRTYSVKSSPSASGKNSPCLSGYNTPSGKHSPNLTGKASPSGKVSPRVSAHSSTNSSPKANVEFFSTKIVSSKCTAKPEPKAAKEVSRLSEIKEKDVKECAEEQAIIAVNPALQVSLIEIGKAIEYPNVSPKEVVVKSQKSSKLLPEKINKISTTEKISNSVKAITDKLDAIENEFLAKQISDNTTRNENLINEDKEFEEKNVDMKSDTFGKVNQVPKKKVTESLTESEDNFGDVSNESSNKSQFVGENLKNNSLVTEEENLAHFTKKEICEHVKNDTENDVKGNENSFEVTQHQRCMVNNVENETKKPEIKTDNHETNKPTIEEVKAEENLEKNNVEHEMQKHEPQVVALEIKQLDIELSDTETKIVKTEDEHEPKKGDTKEVEDESTKIESKLVENDIKKYETKNFTEIKPSRAAYSQAAAKPKPINAVKSETKIVTTRSTTPIARSRTVVEVKPNIVPRTQKQFLKRSQPNKCSYPFNLTTGRTTLFDTSSSIASRGTLTLKKPMNRNLSTGSGDTKPVQKKVDACKMPPRPITLNINEKGDKKEKLNATLEKIKDCEEYSSTDTIVTQIDMSRIESSESLKTLVPEELHMMYDVTNSIEVLNVDNNKSDNEGWLTVKSRRFSRESKKHSRSHWTNRFNQPSATTSLPTLNVMESPNQETKPIVCNSANAKLERAKSEQPQNTEQIDKTAKIVKVATKTKSESKAKNASIIRQKSDVTGLKTRSARNKARAEKAKDSRKQDGSSELTKNRLHSSLESLTMGLARSQESTEGVFDFDKWKAEFKTKFKYLDDDDQVPNDTEILKTADPSEMSEIAEMTSQIEENERKLGWALDFQSEVDQRKLCEEEDLLNRQIMELQQVSDIDMDTETDDTETDAEIVNEDNSKAAPSCSKPDAFSLEDQYGTALAAMSLAERMDTLVVLEELVARDPGRAQQLHAKLSQGMKRRGSLQDAVRRLHAKQARAERQRLDYQTERTKKIHQLLARVEEVKIAKNQVIEEKRLRMERRLQKAAENRHQYLKDKVRKAHDEEEKLKEIAFIKQLEAENKSIEFFDICRSHTARLRQMRRDRLMKLEQKAARDAAVGARRQALEEARRLHVETLLEKKKERDARVDHLNQIKKQERDDAAREKAEGVKSRLSALAAAAELEADALRSRIRDKQDASQQRLESHLQAIREKATGPRQATISESQDQATKELEEEVERLEQEKKERDRQKAVKKRARKFKQKLLMAGNHSLIFNENAIASETFLNPVAIKMSKVISQIKNIISPLVEILNKEIENKSHEKSPVDDDIEKNNKKNTVYGNTEHQENGGTKKKSKKKKTAEENLDIVKDNVEQDKIVENNNTGDTKIIEIETKPEKIVPNDQPKTENTKKKKKNKNKELVDVSNENKIDKNKLSKASSICSSISDTSKASIKVEKQANLMIDVPMLERQLNELYRLVERFGKNAADKTTFQKLQGLKTLGQLLAIVAEREHLAAQFTPKSLTTAVSIMSVWVGSCCGSAAYLVSTNTCVHAIKLLSDQLEKDLQSDFREMELTKHLGDFLSIAFDSVLCSTRLYEEGREKTGKVEGDLELLTVLRARAHTLISYLCLTGCVGRAEGAGEARESVQTLLTVCADLCHPCEADVGTERSSAQQALRSALGTSLCGSRAEFCMLFARGAGLEECGGFVRAARTAHLLRALAEMDHHIVQEAFGEGGWQLEFRAAVARLLSQHAPSEKEAPRTTALKLCNMRLDQSLSETMVLDLIVLVGFVVVNNPQLQETICDGWSVIKTLCSLPANWLVSKPHNHALLPTLAALSEIPDSPVRAAIASEINLKLIEDCLENPEAQKVKLVQVIKQERCKRVPGKNNAKKILNRKNKDNQT